MTVNPMAKYSKKCFLLYLSRQFDFSRKFGVFYTYINPNHCWHMVKISLYFLPDISELNCSAVSLSKSSCRKILRQIPRIQNMFPHGPDKSIIIPVGYLALASLSCCVSAISNFFCSVFMVSICYVPLLNRAIKFNVFGSLDFIWNVVPDFT